MDHDKLLLMLLPLVLIELTLKVAALISLSRARAVRGGSRAVWAALILLVSTLGSVAWFLVGRQDAPEEGA